MCQSLPVTFVSVKRGQSVSLLCRFDLKSAGLTEIQAEQKIAEVLESNGLVSHPEVGVVVKEHKSKPITIVGAVAHPMVYEADRPVTLLEAIAQAGGVSNDAGDTVIVTRAHAATFVEIPNPTSTGPNATSWLWRACRSQRSCECSPCCNSGQQPCTGHVFSFSGRDGQESCPIGQLQSSACFGSKAASFQYHHHQSGRTRRERRHAQ